jgi:GxxExxY protein
MIFNDDLTHKMLSCVYSVHSELGPGLLESTYEACLEYELKKNGFQVQRQVSLPVLFKDIKIDAGYRIDLLVENEIILELKSVDDIHPVYFAQLMTYLKLSKKELGYLLNFNVKSMKDGIFRRIITR